MFLVLLLLFPALAPPPATFESRIQAGVTALDRNDLAAAQANLEQAAQLKPGDAGTWMLLAQTYAKQKNRPAALAAAQKAEGLGDKDPEILQGLANFYGVLMPDLPKAASIGERYAALAPEDSTAWRKVAALYLSIGQPEKAIEAGMRGVKADDSAEMHAVLGQAYLERKELAKARTELAQAVKLNPRDEEAQFRLAQSYLLQQDFPGAIAVLENAKKTFRASAQIELALGVAYYGQRRFTDAVDRFLRVMELAPEIPQSYYFAGRILEHATDRLPEVTARAVVFETQHPQSPIGYVLHAKAIVLQLPAAGYPPEAAQAATLLAKALALKEDQADAHYMMGTLLERQKDYPAAAAHLERSIALNETDPAPHFRLARVYDRMGRKEDAAAQRALHEKLSNEEGKIRP